MVKEANTTKQKSRMPQIGESVFDIGYLLFDLIAAVLFFTKAAGRPLFYLYGALTLLLGGGDAFHLIGTLPLPRNVSDSGLLFLLSQ